MPTPYERLTNLDCDVSFGADGDFLVRHTDVDMDIGGEEWDADAGSVGFSQWTPGREKVTGNITFQIGGSEIPADLPKFGEPIEFLAIRDKAGNDILPDINDQEKYGVIGSTGTKLKAGEKGVWTATVGFRSGVLARVAV